jgi:hypothetical protein
MNSLAAVTVVACAEFLLNYPERRVSII